jgi:glutaredoxin 2
MGEPSIADALLAADLYPLQILDGISLPIDLMYYLRRVEETCATSLDAGLLSG